MELTLLLCFGYLICGTVSMVIASNFWDLTDYSGISPPCFLSALLWPVFIPMMLTIIPTYYLYKKLEPGWIQRGIKEVLPNSLLKKKVKEQEQFIDSLEQRFLEIERKIK